MIKVTLRNSTTGIEWERFFSSDGAFARWFKWITKVADNDPKNPHLTVLVEDAND